MNPRDTLLHVLGSLIRKKELIHLRNTEAKQILCFVDQYTTNTAIFGLAPTILLCIPRYI